jgi:hypothetical protein
MAVTKGDFDELLRTISLIETESLAARHYVGRPRYGRTAKEDTEKFRYQAKNVVGTQLEGLWKFNNQILTRLKAGARNREAALVGIVIQEAKAADPGGIRLTYGSPGASSAVLAIKPFIGRVVGPDGLLSNRPTKRWYNLIRHARHSIFPYWWWSGGDIDPLPSDVVARISRLQTAQPVAPSPQAVPTTRTRKTPPTYTSSSQSSPPAMQASAFTDIAKDLSRILAPLSNHFPTQQQAMPARYPQPRRSYASPKKSNVILIAGVVGAAVLGVLAVVMLRK